MTQSVATTFFSREPGVVGGVFASTVTHAPILLQAEGLKKSFDGQVVLGRVDLELRQGEVVLLRGENGSGKTTLLNILTGNMEPDTGTIHYTADSTKRTYRFPRKWWQKLNPFDHFTPEVVVREGVCRTWQDVRLFNTQSLRDNIAVAEPGQPGENPLFALLSPRHASRKEDQINCNADAMLARFGLASYGGSSADKISLGQTKRVAIARAVAAGARILFLDEPLAGLDRSGIDDVLGLLESLVGDHSLTLVIVEHVFNQPHLEKLVTTDWLLINGTIKRSNGNGENKNRDTYSTAASNQSIQRPSWVSLLAGEDAEILDEHLPRGAFLTRIRRLGIFEVPPKPVLEISDLIVKRGSRVVIGTDEVGALAGFDFTLYAGEIAILFAPNGWGKSTLFASISGLIPSESGCIVINGTILNDLTISERFHLGLRALKSDHFTFPDLSVKEVMRLAGMAKNAFDLGDLVNRTCSSLSGGERKRVALAAMVAGTIGLYDEPFSALDEFNTTRFPVLGTSGTVSAQLILVPGQY